MPFTNRCVALIHRGCPLTHERELNPLPVLQFALRTINHLLSCTSTTMGGDASNLPRACIYMHVRSQTKSAAAHALSKRALQHSSQKVGRWCTGRKRKAIAKRMARLRNEGSERRIIPVFVPPDSFLSFGRHPRAVLLKRNAAPSQRCTLE